MRWGFDEVGIRNGGLMITRVVCRRVDAYGITFHLAGWSRKVILSTGTERLTSVRDLPATY